MSDLTPAIRQQLEALAYCGHDRQMTPEQRIAHDLLSPVRKLINECDAFQTSCADCASWLKQLEAAYALGQAEAQERCAQQVEEWVSRTLSPMYSRDADQLTAALRHQEPSR